MTPQPPATRTTEPNPWTIARIHDTLTSPVLIRHFLLDLTHAPAHEVMNVFAAWQRVAATIEANNAATPPTAGQRDGLTPQIPDIVPPTWQ
ncbi:hypothetical protein [Streptomyces sp. HPF1205]|uniref:hypothetical protein n=1 Tax=Streptomyces sp. HPF1205 TaxID=2873262 RepID=UPI001CEC589A|nr:hypothetical protein [Streptomyces sp. HPF1205]